MAKLILFEFSIHDFIMSLQFHWHPRVALQAYCIQKTRHQVPHEVQVWTKLPKVPVTFSIMHLDTLIQSRPNLLVVVKNLQLLLRLLEVVPHIEALQYEVLARNLLCMPEVLPLLLVFRIYLHSDKLIGWHRQHRFPLHLQVYYRQESLILWHLVRLRIHLCFQRLQKSRRNRGSHLR